MNTGFIPRVELAVDIQPYNLVGFRMGPK
jgi:hypothetical protein